MDYRTRMRNIREDRDLTQKQVGEIINTSNRATTISKPEERN